MVGYTGGRRPYPVYRALGDHTESLMVNYDPELTSLDKLLTKFWTGHDPSSKSGKQYKSALWYRNDEEKAIMEKSMEEQQEKRARKFTTTILPLKKFYRAEEYHQNYLGK